MKSWQGLLAAVLGVCIVAPTMAYTDQVSVTEFKLVAQKATGGSSSATGGSSTSTTPSAPAAPKVEIIGTTTTQVNVNAPTATPICKYGYYWVATSKQCVSNPEEHWRTCKVNEYSDSNDPEICILKGTGYTNKGGCGTNSCWNGKVCVVSSCWNGSECQAAIPGLSAIIPVICPKLLKQVNSANIICTYGYKLNAAATACVLNKAQKARNCPSGDIQSGIDGTCINAAEAGNGYCGYGAAWDGTGCKANN